MAVSSSILDIIDERSTEAVDAGHEFDGYCGISPNEFDKETLIKLLNIMMHEVEGYRFTCNELSKRLFV